MTAPDPDSFAVVAALSGRELAPDWIAAAAAGHATMAEGVAALRAVPLALVDAIEPAHALARLAAAPPEPRPEAGA